MSDGNSRSQRAWAYGLGVVSVLIAGAFWQVVANPPPAMAQVPDSGAQRFEMISELRASNQKLTEIVGLLTEIRELQKTERKDKDRRSEPSPGLRKP